MILNWISKISFIVLDKKGANTLRREPKEHTCERCKNSELIVEGKNTAIPHQLLVCGLGSDTFTECQVACTEDYFEPKERPNKNSVLFG